MLNMLAAFRKITAWFFIFIILLLGPIKAHGLVLCIGCEDKVAIDVAKPDGSCSSCPEHQQSKFPDTDTTPLTDQNNVCQCVDTPLASKEVLSQQVKNHYTPQLEIISYLTNYFFHPLIQTSQFVASPFISDSSSYNALVLKKSTVLLI